MEQHIEEFYLNYVQQDAALIFKDFNNIISSNLKKDDKSEIYKSIASHIYSNPFPCLKLLDYIVTQAGETEYAVKPKCLALQFFNKQCFSEDCLLRFINFIVNLDLPKPLMRKYTKKIIETGRRAGDKFYIALLANHQLTSNFLSSITLMRKDDDYLSKDFVFDSAHKNKEHFVCLAVQEQELTNSDSRIRNALILARIIYDINSKNQSIPQLSNILKPLERFDTDQAYDIQVFFYKELRRLENSISFIQNHSNSVIPVNVLVESNNILEFFYEYKNISLFRYEDIRQLIESNRAFQNNDQTCNSVIDTELETLAYFSILIAIDEIIMCRNKDGDSLNRFTQENINQVNIILRQIGSFETLCKLLEDIFQLIFLRWEHFDSTTTVRTHETIKKPFNSSTVGESHVDVSSGHTRHGFVCGELALKSILRFLKNFVTKKLHSEKYKACPEAIQKRFTRLVDCINDGMWKYLILEKNSPIESFHKRMEAEDLLQLIQIHKENTPKLSSDDDCQERSNYASLARRKAKKRRRATLGASDLQRNSIAVENSSANDHKTGIVGDQSKTNDLTNIANHRSIIPSMLANPETLAIMALASKNFDDVKYIIQTFNLHDTALNCELNFVENQQQTTIKLQNIYNNYLKQELNSSDAQATVEQIKKAAAKGFEASKMISIIDNFANNNAIPRAEEIQTISDKYTSIYPFMQYSQGSNIRAIIASDLILNLNINYDIISHLLPIIRRMCKITKTASSTAAHTGLPLDIGSLPFLDNVCECLRVLKSFEHTELGLKDLLSNSFLPLKPKKLNTELHRKKIFNNIFYKCKHDLHRTEDLKTLSGEFHELKSKCNYFTRFVSYVENFSKLLQIQGAISEFRTDSLLKFDPSDIIGGLIFEENMTPLEIESYVIALNLNLVHVIAINICPDICGKESKEYRFNITKEEYQSIFNYVSNQNALLGYVLKKIKGSYQAQGMNEEYLERYVQCENISSLANIYDGNQVVAALLSGKLDKYRIQRLQTKITLYEILQNCREQVQDRRWYISEKDKIITELIDSDPNYVYLATHLSDINHRASFIYKNFTKVSSSHLAKYLIESTLLEKDAKLIDSNLRFNLERTLEDINIYSKVSEELTFESWPQAYDFGLKTPITILEKLLSKKLFKLCYEWCNVVQLATSFSHQNRLFFDAFLSVLIEFDDGFDKYLLQALETFPIGDLCLFYNNNKEKFKSIGLLNYVIDFLSKNTRNTAVLKNYKVSIRIIEQLTPIERTQNWTLLGKPLLMIEQLIMNAKFEILTKVLDTIRSLVDDRQSDATATGSLCKFCFDKHGNIYDIHSKNSNKFTLGNENSSAFILLNFNLYQNDHVITRECVDLLLRIYATKALDYQVHELASSSERVSQSTDLASLDSLCGTFTMPKTPPTRDQWIQDEEAAHCMCCRRAVFTMLMRRHHCRRCGRVVCFACSSNRMQIPNLYEDVAVRVCNDCVKQTEELDEQNPSNTITMVAQELLPKSTACSKDKDMRWKLSGNITHDKLLREEFCYEHAPSVALCLSILSYHSNNHKCVDLLLYHCSKLEKLLVPNPEVDFELIAKMMNCLALAAKVRSGPPEVETIREHSDIIMSVVQSGCEHLIPAGPLNNHNLRKLADSLVQVEKWQLALEIHWKCGFPTAGIMAAHGLACLRAGCFETARDKFSHCLTKLSTEHENIVIQKIISSDLESLDINKRQDIPRIKRPNRSAPLLQEIIKIIESIPYCKPQPETAARISIIRNSNTSLASMLSKRSQNITLHEPAINILNTLNNLKHLTKGQYCDNSAFNSVDNKKQIIRQSRTFEECLYYILSYGSHADIIDFFIRRKEIAVALRYFIVQGPSIDIFIHHIFLVFLKTGAVTELIQRMLDIDERLVIWKDAILQTCRYLENKNFLHSLYELQVLLKDPIRASMMCVKFFSMNCQTFQQLQANCFHLHDAHRYLQSELELCQWEDINHRRKNKSTQNTFLMQMDAKSLNAHINTILRQIDITKFLAQCERDHAPLDDGKLITEHILKQIRIDNMNVPTLFDSVPEKIQLCILVLLSGKNIEEGFGLVYRIIQNYKLPSMKIFGGTAKYLVQNNRLSEVEKLLNCIISNNGTTSREIDEILTISINSATNIHDPEIKLTLDNLVKKINSVELRISSHIFMGQLKSAYLLAIQHNRMNDIRKILRQAELSNQLHIKRLCEKKLNMSNK